MPFSGDAMEAAGFVDPPVDLSEILNQYRELFGDEEPPPLPSSPPPPVVDLVAAPPPPEE